MKELTQKERESRIIARGETGNHCHVVTGNVEFNDQGQLIVSEDSNAVLRHLLETDWMEGKETWTGEHTDITLTPGTYEYVPQQVFDPLVKMVQRGMD